MALQQTGAAAFMTQMKSARSVRMGSVLVTIHRGPASGEKGRFPGRARLEATYGPADAKATQHGNVARQIQSNWHQQYRRSGETSGSLEDVGQ